MIFFLSGISELPEEASFLHGIDKCAHFVEYYFFGFLIRRWLMNERSRSIRNSSLFFTIMIGICYALSDEWHQSYIPGRDSTNADVLSDALGIIAAAVTYRTIVTRIAFLRRFDEILERKSIHE